MKTIRTLSVLMAIISILVLTGCEGEPSQGTETTVPALIESDDSETETIDDVPAIEPEETGDFDETEDILAEEESLPSQSENDDEPGYQLTGAVSLEKRDGYYEATIDYTSGLSAYDLGAEYGFLLDERVPGIQSALDTFVYQLIDVNMDMYIEDMGLGVLPDAMKAIALEAVTDMLYERMPDVTQQIPQDYIDELEGLASTLCDTEKDVPGDGKLSKNELYFTHLMGEVARTVQCSATGVGSTASATGDVMAARGFDLDAGIPGYGSITKIIREGRTAWIIGWLGNLTAFTGFNDTGLFGAVVDTTGSGEPYTSSGIYSYAYDLRTALEEADSVDSAAGYLDTHPYGFNHLIFLADPEKTGILENNISGTGDNMRRDIRYGDSALMPAIEWPYDDIVIGVSAFMLEGNHDNFTESIIATSRFDNYIMLLEEMMADGVLDREELRAIHSYDGIDGVPSLMEYGDIYNVGTRYIVLFIPATLELEVWFITTEKSPDDPDPFIAITAD